MSCVSFSTWAQCYYTIPLTATVIVVGSSRSMPQAEPRLFGPEVYPWAGVEVRPTFSGRQPHTARQRTTTES
jgi:hypothetical protein